MFGQTDIRARLMAYPNKDSGPEARISGIDKEIIPVWGTRLRHQSANKAAIVTDALTYWFGSVRVITHQQWYKMEMLKNYSYTDNIRINKFECFTLTVPQIINFYVKNSTQRHEC